MDFYCVMGNPVTHSRSPWIHARFAELTGQSMRYERQLVPLDGFSATLQAFRANGGHGCNVTVPFKLEAAAMATWKSPGVALAGAANTLAFDMDAIRAHNTDGPGLVADITDNAGVPLAGRDVLLIGAGGAAAGVLGPLIGQRPRRITLTNRTAARAAELAQRHAVLATADGVSLQACALDADELATGFDVVINATASSLGGAGVPVPASVLKPGALALDMMYGPAAQGFLDWAAAHGAQPRDGLGMLVEQAAESFLIWRGVRPPSAQVLAELRRFINQDVRPVG
jgi:shikimate dehydrogenase